jgi:hypothetical protein
MRVCQPGPVAFQRAMTSAGNRSDINLRGFIDTGLPPFLILARFNTGSVSSGSSSYSVAFTTCASTRAKSDFKERRDAALFAFIGFHHTKYMATCASRRRAHNNHPAFQIATTNYAGFAVVFARVFIFQSDSGENLRRVPKIQPAICEGLGALRWVEGDSHELLYLQQPRGTRCAYRQADKEI